jgi:hypothetical protein
MANLKLNVFLDMMPINDGWTGEFLFLHMSTGYN